MRLTPMSSSRTRKLKWIGVVAAILAAGVLAGGFMRQHRRAEMLSELLEDAARTAAAFDPAEVRALAGARGDLGNPAYAVVKQRLRRLRAASEGVRDVRVLRARGREKVILLADSASAGAEAESLPGEVYSGAEASAGLQRVIQDGAAAAEGPLTDAAGTWITAFALIGEGAAADGVITKEILGIDMDAGDWNEDLWEAGFQGAFYVWVLLGLPLGALLIRRQQDEQRDAIRNLTEAMEQNQSAILIVDLETRIEYANRGLCTRFGVSRRDLLGHKWRESGLLGSPALHDEILATVRAGRAWEGEWQARRKDGTEFPARAVVAPVRRRSGAVTCYVALIDDVSETHQRERELREARDLAEAGDRAKGQFLATMSHEVRTPLNGIVGFTSLLLETQLSTEQREYVQTIKMSTEALIQLTGDILDFARIESGKLKLEPLACDPRECIEDALDLLAQKAAEKGIELVHDVPESVPAALMVDGGRLRQVLVNLVGNAVKFTERGEVEVTLAAAEAAPAGAPADSGSAAAPAECVLTFSVRDTGIGIAPAHHARLFRPFSQVDETSTRRYGGTGLGLAISRNLVGLMGGEIDFVSEAGKGSTFRFTLRAPVAVATRPARDLGRMKIGVVAQTAPLARELKRCLGAWNAVVGEPAAPEDLAALGCELGIVEVSETFARELAARDAPLEGIDPEKLIGLVAINLSNDLRTALRLHFRLLVNRPLHHDALFSLLAGARRERPAAVARTHFGFRVLVVEDNLVNQHLIRRVLTGLGCTFHVVGNGRLALDELQARAGDFDLVLLDFHMPEMDGLAALEEIRTGRAGARAQTMWIIALTADAREDQRMRAAGAGINDYLTKPVRIEDVEAALKRFRTERGVRRR